MLNKFKTIKEMLENMDVKINHIEDMVADNRALLVKLVKQGNQVVNFLKELEADIDEQYGITAPPTFEDFVDEKINEKNKSVQNLIDDFMKKTSDLKEFEEELKKNKDKLTPGQIGES